jgi:signal transduction histidine kinase/integral membrane sensor domain MASE1
MLKEQPPSLTVRQSAYAALAVAAAYYAGVQIGLALTFAPATTSVLWPPNAVLTSALLLIPVRQWWLVLGAAFPVHVVLEMGAGFSPLLVLLLFLTNCSEAIIAAGGLRVLSGTPTRFDTLHGVAMFICVAGLLAPVSSSFLDAAVVTALRNESYWDVWQTRVFSNTLTELSIVPAVILGLRALRARARPSRARLLEATAMIVGLAVMAMLVFGEPQFAALPGVPRTPTVLLLPLFFWSAVRFGVGGVSAALLVTALVASIMSAAGHRPFGLLPPLERLMAVQMYATVMGVPLMCLAGLLDERRRAAADLALRLRFEELLALVSSSFVRPPHAALPSVYRTCLARIGEFFQADLVWLHTTRANVRIDRSLRCWRRDDESCDVPDLAAALPWALSRVADGEPIVFESLAELPAAAVADRATLTSLNVESAAVVPCVAGGAVHAGLVVASHAGRRWPQPVLEQMRLLAEVLSNACAREEAEFDAQRARQELAQVARIVTMAELTSSLAHELNQPLTGILSNAQAAARFLQEADPCHAELRAIVSDIIDDDRRASNVIKKLRERLARESSPDVVDLNEVVQAALRLIANETIIRNVPVTVAFAPESATVVGVRVELQQAVLNVLTNAIEAVAERQPANRRVDVRLETTRCDATGRGIVRVTVLNSGKGPTPNPEEGVFEPSLVGAGRGLGMGLNVARVIVEKHGGSVRVRSADAGAVITLAIPHSQE